MVLIRIHYLFLLIKMKQLYLFSLLIFSQLFVFGQDRKNDISILAGLSVPAGKHSEAYAKPGYYNFVSYKRGLNAKWKLTAAAFTANMQFNKSAFLDDYNAVSTDKAEVVSAKSWKVTSLNLGAEWKLYHELYAIIGVNLYNAKYPELTINKSNATSIKMTASSGSGIGASGGLGYAIKLGKNERWEIPVNVTAHMGSIDYGNYTYSEQTAGTNAVAPGSSMGYISLNIGAGLSFRF